MKLRFLKTISVDVEKPHSLEVWAKTINKWDEIRVNAVFDTAGGFATIETYDGEFLLNVPKNAFEPVKEEKRTLASL